MTIQTAVPPQVAMIPETAPFNPSQRAWLNGFFAGILSLDHTGATPMAGALPGQALTALAGDGDDGNTPWHDPAMPISERMQLADGRPQRRKLFAAMAQQNCGQCGYQCESYAEALAAGAETKANLCVPGGKDTQRMLKSLLDAAPAATPAAAPDAAAPQPIAKGAPGYSRDNPVDAVFRGARRITGDGSEKDTRHIVFDISASGIDYAPGDSFGVYARNDPALADLVLAAMKAPADFPIGGKSFRDALIEDYSLGAAPDMLFELLSYLTGGARRKKAQALAKGQDPDGDAATLDVLSAIEKFGPVHPDPEAFLECLEPLQPRLYSISSSPLASPGELHLTVDTVRYDIGARRRLGVASTYFADRLEPGSVLKVYIQKAHGFGLPADPATPLIMVGPGTGLAPFRSFLWHRKATGAPGRNWLFFGHQRETTDSFYRDEISSFLDDGTLTRLSNAWSRDGAAKVYVQDRMREAGAEVWGWLRDGACFYVCGDAKRMAKDVDTALCDIVTEHGRLSPAAARDYLAELKAAGRYQADVY
ncbi:MAG: sulfite reductase subunit alpha [Hyphomicrobium sp.]